MYIMESAPGPVTVINGRKVDYFCGTGYFGLHGHPELIKAACEATRKYGIGSGTSRSGYGNNPALIEVEERAANFFEKESALYYVSGYLGNFILLQGLKDRYDVIFVDAESHYSVMDGAAVAQKPIVTFAHLDAEDLKKKLHQKVNSCKKPLLLCDGVFPISGEISPIPRYFEILKEFDDFLICVDDAHATGIIGEKGQGTYEYFGLDEKNLHFSGTLSKAFGGHGGIIAGDEELINRMRRLSNIPYSSSSVPTPAAAATAKALEILSKNPEMRKSLWENVFYAKKSFRNLGLKVNETPVPIICLEIKGADLKSFQQELFNRGFAVHYVPGGSYSSVPEKGALRIAVFSGHTREQIDRLIEEFKKLL